MKHRSPAAVFFLPFITLGIYSLLWHVKTKNEMNRLGSTIPTAWLLIVPFVNWYWLWKYSEGVEKVTGGQTSGVLAFVLLFLLGFIGMAILQNEFNKVGDTPLAQAPAGPGQPVAAYPAGQPQPDNSFGGPASVSPNSVSPGAGITTPTAATPPTPGSVDPNQPQPPQLT